MKAIFSTAVLAALVTCSAYAQDISGDWQGTLKAGVQQLRIILHIAKSDNGGWNATMFSIDQQPDGIPVNSITLQDSNLKFTVDAVHGSYEGKVSADGAAIAGTWTQGRPLPLEFQRATKETAWKRDPSPHTVQFIAVDKNVKLEVLDWGGSGRAVVLLAGLGNTAHIFDKFAPKLTPTYHVYGITRRGFGASTAPVPDSTNYSADRLGDDVLAVCDSLKLNRPVLIGHSIAGEELSSIGSRHPEKVAGLIYLDAGYSYAFYDRLHGDVVIDALELEGKLRELQPGQGPLDQKPLIKDLLETTLPQFERDLQAHQKELESLPPQMPQLRPSQIPAPSRAILDGQRKYTDIKCPVLAIYAVPHDLRGAFKDPSMLAAAEAADESRTRAQAKAFQRGIPQAHIILLPHASHFVFFSNEADVLREVNTFLHALP
jgi:pimeloyl-ACP methyl ester carboxylesterase